MIKIKTLTVKNFMSVGNVTQAVDFDKNILTLVLGENLDLGGDDSGSRNGTGKTTIINALSYGLYGQALTNIRKDNLVNKTNTKGMAVSIEFEKDGNNYRIERGRKPTFLRLYVNDQEMGAEQAEVEDESQGDSRETQKAIETMIGLSHDMFKHIMALNTYTEPFLTLKTADQRTLIEQLLGITQLGQKAEALKENVRGTKEAITNEEYRIKAIMDSNTHVQETINSTELKSNLWDKKKADDIASMQQAMDQLKTLNIEQEIELHSAQKKFKEDSATLRNLTKQRSQAETIRDSAVRNINKITTDVEKLNDHKCHACGQEVHDDNYNKLLEQAQNDLTSANEELSAANEAVALLDAEIKDIGTLVAPAQTFYDTVEEAYQHRSSLDSLASQIEASGNEDNPFIEQINELKNRALQEVSYETINELTKIKDHQEFLHKLLTSKDSFIRKSIIEQNLSYLNKRLAFYLDRMGLPHSVKFVNDLSVEITELGRDLDFDNLSRGERNRLILSLSWAFRDVWESLYQPINLLFVDELVDNGLDASGVDAAIGVLKKMTRERQKSIFLVSHRDDLIARVNTVLKVVKENGYTSYSSDVHIVEHA
jgi:DNA repair exonuclease SbcCD ATPase subunit